MEDPTWMGHAFGHLDIDMVVGSNSDGDDCVTPRRRSTYSIFKHCSGDKMVVTLEQFEKEVWPVLNLHGFNAYHLV